MKGLHNSTSGHFWDMSGLNCHDYSRKWQRPMNHLKIIPLENRNDGAFGMPMRGDPIQTVDERAKDARWGAGGPEAAAAADSGIVVN
jgi:hypothetical protein